MQEIIKETLVEALAHEIPQVLHDELYTNLMTDLHRESRNHNDNYNNTHIRQSALAQAQYHAILQAFDNVFKNQDFYQFCQTTPKGGYFSQITLNNLILIPRRSVAKEEWRKANYLKSLARNNQCLNHQADLFPEYLPQNQKILVIVDVLYENNKPVIHYLVPNSRLDGILAQVHYLQVLEQFEKPINTTQQSINPVVKLKKTLEEVEKIAINQR